eukprot:gene21561-28554_t
MAPDPAMHQTAGTPGVVMFAWLMGSMAAIIATLSSAESLVQEKQNAMEDFINRSNLPDVLADKVRKHCNYVYEREVQEQDSAVIAVLPTNLQILVVLHMHRDAVESVPFFKGKHPKFIAELVTKLKLEFYSPGACCSSMDHFLGWRVRLYVKVSERRMAKEKRSDGRRSGAAPVDLNSVGLTPVDLNSVDLISVDLTLVDPNSVDLTPVDLDSLFRHPLM